MTKGRPTLAELPAPPVGRAGWPWTHGSSALAPEAAACPTLTVVTPSFNQGRYLEATIRSVLLQGYPNLEYFVLDGGSTDESVQILERYSPWITAWESGPDDGQSAAINRGMRMGSGDFALWINSDDMLHPDALARHARTVGFEARTFYAGDCLYMDADGQELSRHRGRVQSLEELLRVGEVWREGGHIVQPEVLFPREAFLSLGGLNAENHYTMDFELWGRLMMTGLKLEYTGIPFGMFRRHPEQKTAVVLRQTDSLVDTAERLLDESDLEPELQESLRRELRRYLRSYRKGKVGRAERLRRWGVPDVVVRKLQSLAARVSGSVEKTAPSDP